MHEDPLLPERSITNEENARRPLLPERVMGNDGKMHKDPFYESAV